jgi:hypothetical protein
MATTNAPIHRPNPNQNDRDPKEVPEPTPVQEPKPHDNVISPPPSTVRMQQPTLTQRSNPDLDDILLPDSYDSFHQTDTSKLGNSDYAAGGHEVENAQRERAQHPEKAREKARDSTPTTHEVAQPHTLFAANEVGSQYGSGHLGRQYETPSKPAKKAATVHKPLSMASNDSHHGQNYENWRINQIAKLDRNYAELRRDQMRAMRA